MGLIVSIVVLVFVDRDPIASYEPPGAGGLGNRVIDHPPVPILAQDLEPFGVRVLPVLDQPQSPLGIERDHERLGDQGFAKQ